MRETPSLIHCWLDEKWYSHYGKYVSALCIKHTIWSRNYTPIYLFQKNKTLNLKKKTCKQFFITIAFMISETSVEFSSVTQSCPTLCNPMNHSMPGLPVHHQLPEFTQTHVHQVSDAIQPSHPLSSPSPPAPYPSQHQSLFQWVNSLHEVAKVLEFQLSHHSFQRNPRADLLQNGLAGSC